MMVPSFLAMRSTDGSGRRCDTALYYGKIFPVHFAVLGHSRKNTSADQMFGYNSQTGSVPVQTVTATEDERFSLFLIIPCERIGKGNYNNCSWTDESAYQQVC